jgi:hypothetical protein
MQDTHKNFWKQPWRGTRVFAWFALLLAATVGIIYAVVFIGSGGADAVETVLQALLISVGLAVLAIVLLLLVRWLSSWRNFKRVLFGVACLITLFALFHVVENVRGRYAWRKLQRAAAAKGESLDYASIVPPLVPDAENMAMAPFFEYVRNAMDPEFRRVHTGPGGFTNENRFALSPFRAKRPSAALMVGTWIKGERTDLSAWQRYYRDPAWDGAPDLTEAMRKRYGLQPDPQPSDRPVPDQVPNEFPTTPQPQSPAADVLLALSKYDPILGELREAARRPRSRFPLRYEDAFAILLPHLPKMRGCAQFLALRAVALLATDQPDRGLDDLRLLFRLIDSIREEPLLISQLVRLAQVMIALQPVWEGLADHKWADAQLATLEVELAKFDFLADYQHAMRGERACAIRAMDYMRKSREWTRFTEDTDGMPTAPIQRLVSRMLVPDGWFEQNKVALGRFHLDYLQTVVNPIDQTVSPRKAREVEAGFERTRPTPYNFFARRLTPALNTASAKAALGQTSVNLARVACALERYRLAHGHYPETLDGLAPAFLGRVPHDLIGGQPLRYRRTTNGQFLLYSVGWNETDDGGRVELKKGARSNTTSMDWARGDWVWMQPAN